MASRLTFHERPARGEATGLLVLHHGRGTDELDLLPLGDALDPDRRLHVVAPRGPLRLPGGPGFHWYYVPQVGRPDPATFQASRAALGEFHDELWEGMGLGPGRTVLGGFSMGTVMSYALALDPERPAPAGILAFSGFVPTVQGWAPALEARARSTRVFIAHGRRDPVIDVDFARKARDLLQRAGFDVDYGESNTIHTIDPADIGRARAWLDGTLEPRPRTH
jgi:phospholipase/carboxylesterase